MPNWCECDLTVEVPFEKDKESQQDVLKKLVAFKEYAVAGKNVLETNKFIPYLIINLDGLAGILGSTDLQNLQAANKNGQ